MIPVTRLRARPPQGDPDPDSDPDEPDQSALLGLVGYNCRRAYVQIHKTFLERMVGYRLRPVEFSVLAVLRANPRLTQKQLSRALNVSPPNLAVLLDRLQSRGLLSRERNPLDGRSQVLSLTDSGRQMVVRAERTAHALELEATAMLSDTERQTLIRLLQKIYRRT